MPTTPQAQDYGEPWTTNDLALAIEFARQRGGDCTLMILYVASQILEHENTIK